MNIVQNYLGFTYVGLLIFKYIIRTTTYINFLELKFSFSGETIMRMLNENWQFVMSSFGQPFVDKGVELYFKYAGYFFDSVPARNYILDDLTPYARP